MQLSLTKIRKVNIFRNIYHSLPMSSRLIIRNGWLLGGYLGWRITTVTECAIWMGSTRSKKLRSCCRIVLTAKKWLLHYITWKLIGQRPTLETLRVSPKWFVEFKTKNFSWLSMSVVKTCSMVGHVTCSPLEKCKKKLPMLVATQWVN